MDPLMNKITITTVLSANRVDSGSFSSRCCAFRRTHTNTDPIQLLCIQLALPLTISLPSGFAPSARLMVDVSPYALWLAFFFSCDCMFWDEREGGLAGQPVGTLVGTPTTMTAVMSENRVDLGSFSSRCCTFHRTHRAQTLFGYCLSDLLPSGFAPSERLTVGVPPRALWLAGVFLCKEKICTGVVGTRIDWVLKGEGGVMTTPLLHYVIRLFDGECEIVGFEWGGCKESRPWCSLFVVFPSLFVAPSGEQSVLPMCWKGTSLSSFPAFSSPYFFRAERCS